mgnify:CR=1 FL=1
MSARPTILAPVDFSDASRSALRYARVIAGHFGARLIVLAVEDPLLTEAIDLGTGHVWDPEDTRRELARFASGALGGNPLKDVDVEYEVAVGKPAPEILLRDLTAGGATLVSLNPIRDTLEDFFVKTVAEHTSKRFDARAAS